VPSALQALRQILGHPEDFPSPILARNQQSTPRQLLQVTAGGLMASEQIGVRGIVVHVAVAAG